MSVDPFEQGESRAYHSLKYVEVNQVVEFIVAGDVEKVQGKDFDDDTKPATWPDGNPKYSAVVPIINPDTAAEQKEAALWATDPSALFTALRDAQKTAGARMGRGGKVRLKRLPDKPASNPKYNPARQWAAQYEPNAVQLDTPGDPFGSSDEIPF